MESRQSPLKRTRMRLKHLAAALILALPVLPLQIHAAEGLDYDLSRAYDLLDKGQSNRAKVIFRDYLRRHPRDAWARQGYEQAGGDLAALGLRPLAHADAADAAAARAMTDEEDTASAKKPAKAKAAAKIKAMDEDKPQTAEAEDDNAPRPDLSTPTAQEAAAESGAPVKDGEVPEAGPSWGQRMKARFLGWMLFGKILLIVMLGVGLLVVFAVFGARFARWHAAKRAKRQQELFGSSGPNMYIDERRWVAWWGLGIDNETYNNDLIRAANLAGWRCREVQMAFPFALMRLSFGQLLLVGLIQVMTLGFMRYHVGASLLFERGGSAPAEA
jgi:hypothetical protein